MYLYQNLLSAQILNIEVDCNFSLHYCHSKFSLTFTYFIFKYVVYQWIIFLFRLP